MKILREEPTTLTVFQMVDLWQEGCRCAARTVGLDENSDEREERAQALVTGIMVAPMCVTHDPENANSDGLWSGGTITGVGMATVATPSGEVKVLLPGFGEPAAAPAMPTDTALTRLARRARQIILKGLQS